MYIYFSRYVVLDFTNQRKIGFTSARDEAVLKEVQTWNPQSSKTEMGKTSITNVRVFDGEKISEPRTVAFHDGLIVEDTSGASKIIDAAGGVLLPGLIDAHVHLHGEETLKQLARWGVTTGLDMATWPPKMVQDLKASTRGGGITDFRTPGLPAAAPGSLHSHMPQFPKDELVGSEEAAKVFVESRVAEGVDYIKIIADLPGFEQSTINTLVVSTMSTH